MLHARAAEIFAAEGVERIIHAGDIGGAHVLNELVAIAPVTAVTGNNDQAPVPGWRLEPVERVRIELATGVYLVVAVVHVLGHIKPIPAGTHVVVAGHTHAPSAVYDPLSGALCVNPGSASRPRAGLGRSVAILDVHEERAASTISAGQPLDGADAVHVRVVAL